MLIKKLELKLQCQDQIYNFNDAYIVVKGIITVTEPNNAKNI